MRTRNWFVTVLCVAVAAVGILSSTPSLVFAQQPPKEAVDRARNTIKMLDGIYKQAVVLITDKYVNSKNDYPAGAVAKQWFAAISKDGTHQVRLIDVSGKPYNSQNVAQDAFEKEGVQQLKAGKDYFEQVVTLNGKPQLRAVTAVPVVLEKCVMCHPNYSSVAKGAFIGAISYTMPIQ